MRRREREVTDPREIQHILARSPVLFLALHDVPAPYVIPLFFGHEPGRLYVHCAKEGTKVEILRINPRVGFSAVAGLEIVEGESACDFTASAESVVGTAAARMVDDEAERSHGLDLIMRHYAHAPAGDGFRYRPQTLARTAVLALEIITIIGKRLGNPARQDHGEDLPAR